MSPKVCTSAETDVELEQVVRAWPSLSKALKRAVLALLDVSSEQRGGGQ